jgi:hypothetical protein
MAGITITPETMRPAQRDPFEIEAVAEILI